MKDIQYNSQRNNTKGITMDLKTLHGKLQINQRKSHFTPKLHSGGITVPSAFVISHERGPD